VHAIVHENFSWQKQFVAADPEARQAGVQGLDSGLAGHLREPMKRFEPGSIDVCTRTGVADSISPSVCT
jgi:hypothetical protein